MCLRAHIHVKHHAKEPQRAQPVFPSVGLWYLARADLSRTDTINTSYQRDVRDTTRRSTTTRKRFRITVADRVTYMVKFCEIETCSVQNRGENDDDETYHECDDGAGVVGGYGVSGR